MKTIVFDTASPYLYLSFLSDNKVMYEKFAEGKNRHSENLTQAIAEGLKRYKLKLSDFNKIYLGIGPGSYTGLRVSVTVGKVLGWALNIPIYTASSLDVLASGYFKKDGIYAVTLKAKKNYVYGKLIAIRDGKIKPIIEDIYMNTESFFKLIDNYDYILVNEKNYIVEPINIIFKPAIHIHDLSPNYLRRSV